MMLSSTTAPIGLFMLIVAAVVPLSDESDICYSAANGLTS